VIASDRIPILAAAFTIAYAVIYVICTEVNLPLITYHPAIGEIDMLWRPVKRGPAMYWYGWMLTSLIGAVMVAGVATLVPEAWLQRAIAFGSFLAVSYLVVYSIALFIYDQASVEMEFLKWRSLSLVAAALIASILVTAIPREWHKRFWYGWVCVVPIGAIAVLAYYLVPYFVQ
jgi:hypothetical protein